MKYSDIAKLKDVELKKKLGENQEKLRVFRFGNAMGKSKDVKEGMNTQREIARIRTEMNLRKREAEV